MYYLDAPTVLSVAQLSRYLKELLEVDDVLQNIWVQGEISGCKTYSSGHCYFTLKDAEAQLHCVFFKNARLRSSAPVLRDGIAITANGRISYYERDGKLQLYVECVELIGEGALFLRFEQLKARLAAEGLFDENRKRPLPEQPAVVGIVTSPQAAALRDMLRVLHARYPLAEVLLAPTLVQGSEAPASISAALDLLNEHGEAEVIILGRGGGSIEELWAFNEEIVARAIARSRIPVITPTAAASKAVPDITERQIDIQAKQLELTELMEECFGDMAEKLERIQRDLQRASPSSLLDRRRQQLDDTSALLQTSLQHILTLRSERLSGMALRLHALSPLITIARGYAVVRRDIDSTIVTSIRQTRPGESLTIQVTDGSIPVEVRRI